LARPSDCQPPPDVAAVVREHCRASPLDAGEDPDAYFGLQEIDREPPGEIGDHEGSKNVALAVRAFQEAQEKEQQREREDRFIQLRGVAADSVAEIDAPWQRGGDAVSVVGEAREEATDTADGDAER